MAGKPYGIREMKVIVDYLVEQKAFGEIRGKKRWIDLANSQMTTRTWQSLKETFLKRILPDIHNPYYKLTVAQISSFREGRDVAAIQSNNKLEIRTTTEDSNNIVENQEQSETTETTNLNKENQEESTAGETISSKIPPHSRSSVETLVLDHEGEEPEDDEMNLKSMRDRIIYTEPLTPMIQQVIDDFNTDDENLQIDENPKISNTEETEPEPLKTTCNEGGIAKEQPTKDFNNSDVQEKTQENHASIPKVNGNTENGPNIEAGQSQTQKTNTSTDSTLPNNQEVLIQNDKTENIEKENNVNKFTETQKNEENNNVDTRSRKRTPSVSSNHSTNKTAVNSLTPEKQENLCLKSVSLFDEQFSAPNFVDSDSSLDANAEQGPEEKKEETEIPKMNLDLTKDVVLLKSHSDSDSEPVQNAKITKTVNKTQTITKTRSKAMANIFGFSSGGVYGKHMGLGKKSAHHKKMQDIVISDSEWTSESDAEFVSPPRTRKNRHSRKYIRPSSARILSLEEEGGLFVVHGRKIYPLVKDGKMIKNYVNYFEELDADDDDEEESYWKLRYAQEKLKTAELSKLLENNSALPSKTQTTNSKDKNRRQSAKKPKLDTEMSGNEESENAIVKTKDAVATNEANIKIKFTGHHKEVQLEGHWSQIHPVLQQVVNIFQKDPENNDNNETKLEKKKATTQNINNNSKTESNAEVPIIIQEVSKEKSKPKRDITQLEASIFKEIEEKDNEEQVPTRNRGRPKKNEDLQPSPAKIPKLDERKTDVLPKRTTPRRKESETTHNYPQTRKSLKEDNSEEILYKFPSPPPSDLKTNVRLSTRQKSKARNLRYMEKLNDTSPENKSLHSESTQGYQDSDISPISRRVRRRRKHSFSSLKNLPSKHRVKRFTRRRSHPDLKIDVSSDSSNSSFNIPLKTAVFKNSTLNSDIYKSDSYQLLMPKAARSFKLLESIDETKPVERNPTLSEDRVNCDALSITSHDTLIVSIHNDERNSSNVSLPVSPELSIVEKLSVNKSLLSSDIDFPTLNEIQNNETEPNTNNKYLLSEVDASLPLMQQDCSFYKQINDYERSKTKPSSDSRLQAINAIKSQEINSPSKSLHAKLRDLFLNSAKKIVDMSIDTSHKEEPMEVDSSKVEPQKIRKKRSSTPQKKRKTRITKTKANPPVIEERVEFCLNGGRHSCPPSVLAPIENVTTKPNTTAKDTSDIQKTKSSKKKKDIIKVKILRPKSRTPKKSKTKPSEDETSKGSNETSLGTNKSGIFVQTANDTIDLIHNHSETCLHAHDCIDSSIELLPAAKSHITIHSDSNTIDDFLSEDLADFNIPEMYCSNAQDASDFNSLSAQEPDCQNTVNLMPHVSDLSIFTEDLSDELPTPLGKSSKWYLLSEDETTNTNLQPLRGGLTANLNQIFPIVCAVPDLSTITEISKDADSRKPTFEPDRDDLDSKSVGIVSN